MIDKIHLGWAHTFLKHGWFAHAHVQAHAHAQAHSQAHAHPYTQYLIKGGLAPLLISYYLYGWAWAWAWEYGWAWAWEWAWAWAGAWTWANHPCFNKSLGPAQVDFIYYRASENADFGAKKRKL